MSLSLRVIMSVMIAHETAKYKHYGSNGFLRHRGIVPNRGDIDRTIGVD